MKRKYSLKNKIVFTNTLQNPDKKISNNSFVILWKWNEDLPNIKIGIALSKKIKLSVDRNKYKRTIRYFVQRHINKSKKANMVIIFKLNAINKNREELEKEFDFLLSNTPFKIKRIEQNI